MKLWIMIFSAAVFAGGTCLGVALHPRLVGARPERPSVEGPGGWNRHGEFSVTRFASELDLTEEQDLELDRILGETQRDVEAYGRAMRAAHDRSRERVMALLTAEQKSKLDGLMAAEKRKRSEEEVRRSLARYQKLLGLSEEQSKAAGAALAEGRSRRSAWFEKNKRDGGRDAYHAFQKSSRDEQNRAFERILTPEQYAKYVEFQDFER